jgi:Secretion system C-terminal sorting domain
MKKTLHAILLTLSMVTVATAQSDEPCGATLLTVNTAPGCPSILEGFTNPPAFTNSTNASAGVTIPALTCNGFTTTTLDFWFRVVVPTGGALKINVSDGGDPTTQTSSFWDMACYSSSSATCAGSTFALVASGTECTAANYPDLLLTGLTAGSTVYIRMWRQAASVQTANRAYKICVGNPNVIIPLCNTYDGPTNASILNQQPVLSWADNADAGTFDLYYGTANPPPFVTNTVNTFYVPTTGLSPGTTNYWYVVPKSPTGLPATGCASAVQSFTTAPAITNNECVGAITLTEGNIVEGTTVYATQSRASSTCSGGASAFANDVWYKFRTNATGGAASIDVNTFIENGLSMDAVLEAFSGTCAGLTSIGCVDDGISNDIETLDLTGLAPNTTYYVRVYGWQTSATGGASPLVYQPFDIEVYGNAVIPIELMSFTGNIEDKANRLDWQTASERNVQNFVVERSNSAEKGFFAIGKVKAVGNSSAVNTYRFDDPSPFGVSYYRLRSVDFDGSEQLSKVITVERKGEKFAINRIFPSPTSGETTIEFSSNERGLVELTVSDVLGRLVFQKKLSVTEGSLFEKLDVSTFMTGTYFVRLKSGLNTTEGRFVKQ